MKKFKLICQCGCEVSIPARPKKAVSCQACDNDLRMPNSYTIIEEGIFSHSFTKMAAASTIAVGLCKSLV